MVPHRDISHDTRTPLTTVMIAAVSTLLFIGGCVEEPGITRRNVPKPSQVPGEEDAISSAKVEERPADVHRPASMEKVDGRMLAAVVPAGGQAWFFKISGPEAAVIEQTGKFEALLKTLTIAGGKPVWKTPDGWTEEGGSGFRAATFKIGDADPPLECTVTPLPSDDPESDDYLLENVNRWRRQLALGNQTIAELKGSSEFQQFDLTDGTTITWVNLVGKVDAPRGSKPSAANRSASAAGPSAAGPSLPPGHPPTRSAATPQPADGGGSAPASIPEMTFDVPSDWAAGKLGAFRKIAWNIDHGGKQAEFYISTLAAAGSEIGGNVNRWRGQAGLEKLSDKELSNEVKEISIGDETGHITECFGLKKSIIGAIVVRGDTGWFFKLVGDPDAVSREKDNVKAFLKSVRFK